MNSYEQKQEEKRDKLRARAEKADGRSEASFGRFHSLTDGIPLGQPVLVGHHSEKRHRRTLQRADDAIRKGVEEQKKSQHLREKANSVGSGGISSDDPDSVVKLQRKLVKMELQREFWKSLNVAWRKAKKPAPDQKEAWEAMAESLGVELETVNEYRMTLARFPYYKAPVPGYALSNLGANITRVRERIAEQQAKDTEVYTERDAGTFTVVEDPSINRIQIVFPSKTDKETCHVMRRWGWVFSRTNSAWQRKLNNASRASAQMVEKQLKGDNQTVNHIADLDTTGFVGEECAIYARVSTTDQSTEPQELDLRAYAKARGWKLYSEYCDNGISGTKDSRPALNSLMNDAKKRKFDVVLVWRFDRFARSTKHLVLALEEFKNLGIDFVSYQENVDTSSPLGAAIFTIIGAVAQLERDIIAERVKAGLRRAKTNGKRLGRPEVQLDTQKARSMRLDGLSLRTIAKRLGVSHTKVAQML